MEEEVGKAPDKGEINAEHCQDKQIHDSNDGSSFSGCSNIALNIFAEVSQFPSCGTIAVFRIQECYKKEQCQKQNQYAVGNEFNGFGDDVLDELHDPPWTKKSSNRFLSRSNSVLSQKIVDVLVQALDPQLVDRKPCVHLHARSHQGECNHEVERDNEK